MAISTPESLLNAEPLVLKTNSGAEIKATLKQLTIRQVLQFCRELKAEDSVAMVVVSTGLTVEQVDNLTIESFGHVFGKVMAENFPKVVSMMQSNPLLAADVLPVFTRMQQVATEAMRASAVLSPEPSTSASAEETGSESSTSRQAA